VKYIKIVLGILFIVAVIYSYYEIPQYLVEGTCVSNTLGGVLLIIDGILGFKNKRVPMLIWQMEIGFIMTVYLLCAILTGFRIHSFNFEGGFMFLHSINPLILLAIFLFSLRLDISNGKEVLRRSFIAPVLIMAYLLFDLIRHQITGEFVYGLIPNNSSILIVLIFGVGTYISEVVLNYGLIRLKMFVGTKINK
jgi:hypothetical protein